MLAWRRTMTHLFFWANHLGIYPAASVSLRAHWRLDTVVASITNTTSNIICNILISVLTLIQASQGDLSHLACVCTVWSGHNVTQFMPCPSLTSASQYLHCWQHGAALSAGSQAPSPHLSLQLKLSYSWILTALIHSLCLFDCRREKRKKTPHFLCHFTSLTRYYQMRSHN